MRGLPIGRRMKVNTIKRSLSVLFLLAVALAFPMKSEAADTTNLPDGFLIGDSQGINVTKSGGYFFNLDGLLPGDTITRNLVIQNTRSEDYNLKMVIQPISSTGPVDLIEKMTMAFTLDNQVVYDGNLVSQVANQTAEGTEIDFGVIKGNSTRTMSIDLAVKTDIPWEDFQKGTSTAKVKWTFVANSDQLPNTGKDIVTKPTGEYPSTGETVSKVLFTLGILMTLVTLALYFMYYKRRESGN